MDFFKTKKKKAAPKPAANLNQAPEKDALTAAADGDKPAEAEEGANAKEPEPVSPSKAVSYLHTMPTLRLPVSTLISFSSRI